MHAKPLQSCPALCDPMEAVRPLCPWDSLGKNAGVGCRALKGSFRPRDQTHISYISCIGNRALYRERHPGNPNRTITWLNIVFVLSLQAVVQMNPLGMLFGWTVE